MNLLNKLTIKNLKLNKKRTIVTIIGILLSVALLTAVSTMYASLIESLINFEIYTHGDYHVAFHDVPSNELYRIKDNRNVEEIYTTSEIGYAKIDSKNNSKPYAYILGFTEESINNLSVRLVEGRMPENDNEILIPTHLKTNGRLTLNIGDTITLEVGKRVKQDGEELNQTNPYVIIDENAESEEEYKEEIIETETKEYKVVGIMERPSYGIESYSAPGYTFATIDSKEDGKLNVYTKLTKEGLKKSCNTIAGIIEVDEELFNKFNCENEDVTKEEYDRYQNEIVNSKYDTSVNGYLISLQTNPLDMGSGAGELGVAVAIVCVIIVFTSVFCIKNSFDISITEKTKQYGMLKSIGATKKQIKKNVFYEAFILGLIGIPLGILLGLFASFILVIVCNYFLKDALGDGLSIVLKISWLAIILSIILGAITIYLSALRSAHRASKISPIDSIRNSAEIRIKSKNLKSPRIINKLFGVGGDISYKNLKRNKKKYRTTIISIIISVSVFIALYSFMQLAFVSVKEELQLKDYNISLSVSLDEQNQNEYNKVIGVTNLENINHYTIARFLILNMKENNYTDEYTNLVFYDLNEEIGTYVDIVAVGEDSYKDYINELHLDYDKVKDKGILYNKSHVGVYDEKKRKMIYQYIDTYNYKKGDIVSGTVILNGKEKNIEVEVYDTVDKKPFGFQNDDNSMLIVSDELYDKLGDNTVIDYHVSIVFDSSDPDKLQDDMDEYLKGYNYNINNSAENARLMNSLFTLVAIFLYGFIIVISLIGITNIFNTITTNMELRKQEFAMLKSIGMTTKEFNRMIRLESIFMGLKSLIFGLPIGLILSYLIYYFLGREMGISYPIPSLAIIISILAVFLLITSLMKYSMSKINKQNTIETIRNENI